MAAIVTDEDFRKAAGQHISTNAILGATVLATDRKIMSAQNVDITPSQAVLEAALDTALAEATGDSEIEQARRAVVLIRQYLQRQMVKISPDTPAQQVTAIKQLANGNTHLANVMNNQIAEMNDAFGWSLTLNPATLQTRRQFVFTVKIIVGILP